MGFARLNLRLVSPVVPLRRGRGRLPAASCVAARQRWCLPFVSADTPRSFCVGAAVRQKAAVSAPVGGQESPPRGVQIEYEQLMALSPEGLELIRKAYVGPQSYGAIAVVNIPGYSERRRRAFRAGIDLALKDAPARARAAAVSNTYPGWSGTPGEETHPLQSSFLFNVKEEVPNGKIDAFFGKNIFPSEEYKKSWTEFAVPMHDIALQIIRGCDKILEADIPGWSQHGRSLTRLAEEGPALAGRFICYDSGFTREDNLLDSRSIEMPSLDTTDLVSPKVAKPAGHAGDGLASMRTHSTPVKSAGHAGDGLASMRTHSTPVKSAGHAGDGLASMRTHSTPVKSAGHAGENPSLSHSLAAASLKPAMTDSVRSYSTSAESVASTESAPAEKEFGDYWLPWHIDSNFVTVLHKEMYARESDGSLVPEPEGSGLLMMNRAGDVTKFESSDENALVLQMGAFAQIYSGGHLEAGRHAVLNPRPPGIARFNYCNFWYVPWTTVCDTPAGLEDQAVSKGWNAMMDASYVDLTMRQSFSAFRKFMVSPEARAQFADSVRFKELSAMLPLRTANKGSKKTQFQIDVITDVRCPFSHLSQTNLEAAIRSLDMEDQFQLRFYPNFLNPNVPKEGGNLDDYLQREFGYSKEFAHSEDYPIRKAGLQAGIRFNPNRRVVNTFDAFCLMEAAQEVGLQHQLVKALSHQYFEDAQDISDEKVLLAVAAAAGLPIAEEALLARMRSDEVRQSVQERYEELSALLGEVPHFLLRDGVSGNGLEVGGNRSVEEWEEVLQGVVQKSRLMGMRIPGLQGQDIWLAEANPNSPLSLAVPAQHGWAPATWPYQEKDFARMDESEDNFMYAQPRLVNHLDEVSLARLSNVYRAAFEAAPSGFAVLDLCSSWNSHFPEDIMDGASRVAVHGLNGPELEANKQATERHVQDLNKSAALPYESGSFDFVTMALSVQYLTNPRAVFSEMHRVLKPGGMAIVTYSHKTFIEKAVKVWADETDDGEGRSHIVCRYFQHSPSKGWEKLSSVDVSPQHGDPVWLVTAVKAAN